MLLDFLSRLRRAQAPRVQTGPSPVGRPIARVRFGRLQVPAHVLEHASGQLEASARFHRRPRTASAASLAAALAGAVRFLPVALERLQVAGTLDAGGLALVGTWRGGRRAAELARANERRLLELGEL